MKMSQQEARYKEGKPTRHCGLCRNFEGGSKGGGSGHDCSRIEGTISAFGLCKIYDPDKNPFGSKLGPRETAMIEAMMASGPDQSDTVAAAPAARLGAARIGNKTYG